MSVSNTVLPRWRPDEQLVAAVLAGSATKMADLAGPDRSWVVAGLTLSHIKAEDIADRLNCSRRLVFAILADPMTAVCLYALRETAAFADELRLARSGAASLRAQMQAVTGELERYRAQLNNLLDSRAPTRTLQAVVRTCGVCDTEMSGYNLYVHESSGKMFCRACARRRQADRRARQRLLV